MPENFDQSYEDITERADKIGLTTKQFSVVLDLLREAHKLGKREAFNRALEHIDDAKDFIHIGLKYS